MTSHDSTRANKLGTDSAAEQSRLDDALNKADQLLVESLHVEDRRRSRRKLMFFILSLGGLIMFTAVCLLLLSAPADQDATQNSAPAAAKRASGPQAAQLAIQGWKLWQQQKHDLAIEKFKQATQLDPNNVNAWNGLGWANFNRGDRHAAKDAFARVIGIEPKHPAALNGLGQIAFFARDYDEAEKHLLKAAPHAPAAWYGLAKLYLLQGKYDKAAKWARKIANSGDRDPVVKRLLAAAKAKELPDGLRRLIEPVAPDEVSPHANEVARGWQLMNRGSRDEAKAVFETVLKQAPNDTAALNGMGWLLLGAGEHVEAQPYFKRVLKIEPLAGGAMNGLARVLYAQDDPAGAIALWKKMVDEIPGPNAGTVGLADAYMEQEEYQQAIPLLEQLVEADPNNQLAKNKLEHARAEVSP